MSKLSTYLYQLKYVLTICRELLGKILFIQFDGRLTSGKIVETEAYAGETDKASHAYGGDGIDIMLKRCNIKPTPLNLH